MLKYSIFYPLRENIYNEKIFYSEGILKTVINVLTKKTPKKNLKKTSQKYEKKGKKIYFPKKKILNKKNKPYLVSHWHASLN